MLTVSVLLLIAFDVFFPGLRYKDNWNKARLIMLIKDITLTLDRTNNLYSVSFSPEKLTDFINKTIVGKHLIWWSDTGNAVKPTLRIACNCTDEEIGNLTSWYNRLIVNGRNVSVYFIKSRLDRINEPTDGLVIFGYKDLTPYKSSLEVYLKKGKGIVYIADLSNVDDETKKIFGIDRCSNILGTSCGWGSGEKNITFIKPANASVYNYQPWKLFFHFPETLKTKNEEDSVPVENVEPCDASPVYSGTFKLRDDSFKFWTCNETTDYKLYFDTNGNKIADLVVKLDKDFTLDNFGFHFSYALDNRTVAVAYRPTYNFTDFLRDGGTRVYPTDKDINKIVVYRGNYSGGDKPIPAAIATKYTEGNVAWVANFARDGLDKVGDDEKQLLLSLLLYITDKNYKRPTLFKIGYQLPYINVRNKDMYEVYNFHLGLGYPY